MAVDKSSLPDSILVASPYVAVKPYTVDTSSILSGSTSTDAATIVTVAANQSFFGEVTLSGTLRTASNGGAADANPTVTVQGTSATPASGSVVIALVLRAPASALASPGTVDSGFGRATIRVTAPAGNSVTLRLNTGGATAAQATVNGVILA